MLSDLDADASESREDLDFNAWRNEDFNWIVAAAFKLNSFEEIFRPVQIDR